MANLPQLVVRELTASDSEAFKKALEQSAATDPNFAHYYEKGMSFEQYLYLLNSVKLGFELPVGHIPATILYAFIGDWIVGRLTLRYNLKKNSQSQLKLSREEAFNFISYAASSVVLSTGV